MKIRAHSDLHVDRGLNEGYIPDLSGIETYIIAGDLGQHKVAQNFIRTILEKYPSIDIVHVLGNHEYYDAYLEKVHLLFSKLSDEYEKYHYLQNDSVVIQGIKFIGATLWTSLNNNDPLELHDARYGLNDFKYIRYKNGVLKFTPEYSTKLHRESKEYIFKTLEESEELCVVVTHHKPFVTNTGYLSSAFETELRGDLVDNSNPPKVWISGHDHKRHDIIFDCNGKEVRFISNPKGYPHEKNTGFEENLIIEL